eukprot:CAMPEP_0116115486 /NCGR_PEP_ID=MMETSP0329-20121206/530_1 /TAXON_ID=697910 /ORGANISM="Pseudo-nitzschia arenysensis, Strain B593" /LENGTH=565 /DNA_ID=CAMNT_0003608917 /DNA_START=155 /DNA_END=1852 /DNA_ORIENTATION=+
MEETENTNGKKNEKKNNGRDPNNTPSFLSPVGETSMNYSVILDDDDDIMGLSPITANMSVHPPLHADNISHNRDRYRNSRMHSNGNGQTHDYEASYGIDDDDQYIYSVPNEDGDDDLPRPLLGYNYRHEDVGSGGDDDDDDDRYQHPNRHGNSHVPYLLDDEHQYDVTPKLNGLNYLNVITYGLNVFTSYFIGVRGLFGVLPTRRDIFIEYETLVTPADYAYWLWAPILVFEFFFATAQLLPHYRARPIIQQGTGLYFFWACIIQTIWTVFFAMQWFVSSFVAVVLALLCLVFLLASQHYNCLCAPTVRGRGGMSIIALLSMATIGPPRQRRKSLLEYWFFRFPFYLHCGWLLVCMAVQFSMVFRYRFTDSAGAQLTADIVALGVMLPPATFFLTGQNSGPDFVIPLVILWSYVSIGVELSNPNSTLVDIYGRPAILAVQGASYVFTGLIGVMLVPRIIIWIIQEFCTIGVVELESEEDNITTAINEVRLGMGGGRNSESLFQRFSLRRSVELDGGGDVANEVEEDNDDEERLDSVRRRIENEEVIDEDEEHYEDCQETEETAPE